MPPLPVVKQRAGGGSTASPRLPPLPPVGGVKRQSTSGSTAADASASDVPSVRDDAPTEPTDQAADESDSSTPPATSNTTSSPASSAAPGDATSDGASGESDEADALESSASQVPRSLPRPGRLEAQSNARDFAEAQARAGRERLAAVYTEESGPRRVARQAHNADALVQSAFADLVTTTGVHQLDDDELPRFRRVMPRWLWPTAGAAALVAVLALLVGSGDDAQPTSGSPRASAMVATAEDEPAVQASAAAPDSVVPPTNQPLAAAPTFAKSVDDLVGQATDPTDSEIDEDDAAAVAGDEAPNDADDAGDEPNYDDDPIPSAKPSSSTHEADAGRKTKRSDRSRRRSRKRSSQPSVGRQGSVETQVAAPPATSKASSSPKPAADPQALVQDARQALSAGKARKAYALASRSYKQAKSEEAMLLMGRAACRMKDEAKAKVAIANLSFRHSRTIRKECRDVGLRLGL